MLSNYLRTALRNFNRDLFYSVLNVLGLSFGIAACLLSFLHIKYELSYDQFHSNRNEILRVVAGNPDGVDEYWARMAPTITPYLQDQFPEVTNFVRIGRISWNPKVQVNYQDKFFNEDKFLLADPSFFDVFDFKLIEGSKEQALSDLNAVVISESMANKYFGDESAIGKRLEVDGKYSFVISGVIEDSPKNSHLEYSFIAPFNNVERVFHKNALTSWGEFNYWTYILVDPQANVKDLQEKIFEIVIPVNENRTVALDEIYLQPLNDIHFSDSRGNQKQSYNTSYILIFSLIAIAVLLIACINFINLSTARSARRLIEVGIRKAVGASRLQLVSQFISESMLTTILALVLGIALISVILPKVNSVLDSEISISNILNTQFIFIMLIITIVVGFASGGYIAFLITSLDPGKALKGSKRRARGFYTRDILLLLQFTVSIILIISSIFLTRQLSFIQNKNLGLNKEQIVTVPIYNRSVQSKIEALKNELRQSSEIISVSASSFRAGNANWNQTVWWEGQQEDEITSMFILIGDADFVETLQLDLLEGDMQRIKELPKGERHYILNESAIKSIGWDSGIGKMFTSFGDEHKQPISGIVKDFNFRSLHHEISPTVISVSSNFNLDQILIRVKSDEKLDENIAFIQQTFKEVIPEIPFEYGFLDESFEKLYKEEKRAEIIIESLTFIIIVIALFGLFAMASFNMQERTKEVAIRKVIGITTPNLIILLMKRYLWLLLVSNIIAWPFAWMISSNWIEQFPYRIQLDWWIFISGTIIAAILVVIVVGSKALRTAESNPVNALRRE